MNHLTPALKAAKKQRNGMKFLISLLPLQLLFNFKDQDPDLAPALGQVPDQGPAQNLCHGIIAEENGSRTLSITGLAAGS
jgi:hypothetical protein